MEFLVNQVLAWAWLIFEAVKGTFVWGDQALLIAAAVFAGAFFGTRAALVRWDRPVAAAAEGVGA